MKRLSIIIFVFGVISFASCRYEKPGFYEGRDYIQFYYSGNLLHKDSNEVKTSPVNYPYISSTRLRDTAWFRLKAVGTPSRRERQVRFEQYTNEADKNYIEAVPGVNYVAFDDPEIQKYMVIPADSVHMNIPVVILYDTGTRGSVALNFKLVSTDDFELGMPTLLKGRCMYSNY